MEAYIKEIENTIADVESRLNYLYKTYDSVCDKINMAETLKEKLNKIIIVNTKK